MRCMTDNFLDTVESKAKYCGGGENTDKHLVCTEGNTGQMSEHLSLFMAKLQNTRPQTWISSNNKRNYVGGYSGVAKS